MTAGSITGSVRRFWQLAWDANLTGMSAMLAYNMLLGIIPVALLGLFIAGQVLSSTEVQQSVLNDLRQVFPGTAEHTLNSLLSQIRHSSTSIGVLALIASLWLGSSFWGALDTAFTRIYGCPPRRWLEQKRFGLMMLGVVLLFMVATVAVPAVGRARPVAVATSANDITGRPGSNAAITSRPRASASMKSGPVPSRGIWHLLDTGRHHYSKCPQSGHLE